MSDRDQWRELDEQARRGSLFAQAVASRQMARANQTEAAIYGLIDLLIAKGALTAEEVTAAIERTGDEMREAGRHATLEVIVREDSARPRCRPTRSTAPRGFPTAGRRAAGCAGR